MKCDHFIISQQNNKIMFLIKYFVGAISYFFLVNLCIKIYNISVFLIKITTFVP